MVLHISAYSIVAISAIYRRFVIRARVGNDIPHFRGLVIALANLDALCWIMSVMVSVMVMLSSSYNVVSRIGFSIRDGIRFFL